MVDEYLSEREQAELLRQWLRDNWLWLAAGIALGLGGLYGYRWWEGHREQRSLAAEQRFSAMLDALARNQRDEGVRIGAELSGEYGDTPYAEQAELVLARLEVEAGELAQAATRLAGVMNSAGDPELALVARLRLARVQLAQGQYDAALATLDGAGGAAAAARIAELRGDVLLAKGDAAGAASAWQAAQQSVGAGDGQVDRELLALKIDALAARQPVE